MSGILIWAETRNGEIRKSTREAVGTGLEMARKRNIPLAAVLVNDGALTNALGNLGIAKIYTIQSQELEKYASEGYAGAISQAAVDMQADFILIGATALGRDVAGRVAAQMDGGLALDVTEIKDDGREISVVRPVYSGKLLAEVKLSGKVNVISLRPNVFPEAASLEATPEIKPILQVDATIHAKVLQAIEAAQGVLDVTEAQIIVSGGRGTGGPEGFKLIEKVAEKLGAAVGASRAAVDAGWVPYKHQVGQTGKVVSPVLYIACGISGAIQHFAGMGTSKFIIAINSDPDAPIMKKADFAIAGDLFKVLPVLTEELAKLRAK
jgi:electron transfer flavoprotein alpha subunit